MAWKTTEMSCLRETVNNNKNNGIVIGLRKACDEIKGKVLPMVGADQLVVWFHTS